MEKATKQTRVTKAELRRLEGLPVEDLVEAFNNPTKADELVTRLKVSKPALLVYAEELTKKLIEGLVVVNRV